jgi:plasmid stabilization system protein ParE
MPDAHRVILTADALADLEDIARYIREHSPQNAADVANAILDAIDSLTAMPARYKVVGRSKKRGTPVHGMVVRPFIVYYRVEQGPPAVYVLHVRHGTRRQPRRFA